MSASLVLPGARQLRYLTALLALSGAFTASAAAATPEAVREAGSGLARLEAGKGSGTAFAVTSTGLFVTASSNVARTRDITLIIGQDRYSASRLESTAPRGLVLLQAEKPTTAKPLAISESKPAKGTRLWVLSAPDTGRRLRIRAARLQQVNSVGSLETRGATTIPGENGGPLVTSSGRVIGVTAPPRPGETSKALVSFRLPKLPTEVKPVTDTDGNGFPAVPVVIGLGILLVLANAGVTQLLARRRTAVSPVPVTATPPVPAGASSNGDAALDDLEISLKPK